MNVWDILFGDERYLFLWRGLEVTILLTVFSTIIGLVIGLVVALMQQSAWQPFRTCKLHRLQRWRPWVSLAHAYTTVIRGTPALVQLLIMLLRGIWLVPWGAKTVDCKPCFWYQQWCVYC